MTNRLLRAVLVLAFCTPLAAPLLAQYDPLAERCEFRSDESSFVHNNTVYSAGRVEIDWSPSLDVVTRYEWYFDAWNKNDPHADHNAVLYSKLSGGDTFIEQNIRYTNALDVSLFGVIATTVGLPNNTVIGTLHPLSGGPGPDWVYTANLVQTGTSSIATTGQVQCR